MHSYIDVSAATLDAVSPVRTMPRRGIVLHETIGEDSLEWLQGGSARGGYPVSADFLISHQGDIYQITKPGHYAWHSGKARWNLYSERDGSINQGFFGVEIENDPRKGEVIRTAQYIAVGSLVRLLLTTFHMDTHNLCGHYECALPVGRKADPITLNWAMLTSELLHPSPEFTMYAWPDWIKQW